MKKKILSAIMAVVVATSSLSAVAYAENISPVEYAPNINHNPNEEFTQNNIIFAPIKGKDNMCVAGLVDRAVTEITIPSSVNGKKVTLIDGWAFTTCFNLRSVHIPDSITWIGQAAFAGCEKLESIRLPESITVIEEAAFSDCTSLREIALPKNLNVFGFRVFNGCQNLKNIYYPKSKSKLDEASLNGLEKAGVTKDNPYWQIFDGTITYFNGINLVDTKATIHYNTSLSSQTANPGTPTTTDPRLALALDEAKYALSLAQDILNEANVALENARKKKSYVFTNGGFTQVTDTNAVKEAELDVQRAELIYREAELNYQQIQNLINNSTPSIYGDVDGDSEISFSDVEHLITLFLNNAAYSQKYDLDKSGSFDFDDVSTMITIFLNSL